MIKFQVREPWTADIESNKNEIYKTWVENENDERKGIK